MKNKTLQDYFEKWDTLLDSGNSEAIEAFIPDATHECYRQGLTYFERGSFQEAAEFFQYVSELDPKYSNIYYHMGRAFYKSNNKYQAYIAFKNAIQLRIFNPDYKDASNNMKQVRKDLGIEEDSSNNSDFQIITASISSSYYDNRVTMGERALMLVVQELQEQRKELQEQRKMVQCLETRVSFLEEIAHITGAKLQAKINTAIKELETPENKDIFPYYKKFYWTLQDVFDACGNIDTELIVGDGGQVERLSTTAARKFLCYFLDVLPGIPLCGFAGIPLYGCLIGTIHDAFDNWYNTTLTKTLLTKVDALNNITHSKFNSKTEVIQVLQQLAIIFTYLKKENLVAVEVNEEKSALKTVVNFLKTKIFLIQEKAYSSVGIEIKGKKIIDDEVTKLAFQDATLLISYLYNNSKDLVENPKEFIEQIIEITKQGQLSQIWLNDKIKQNSSIGIEYELYEIAKKVPDPIKKTISDKAATGQWEDYNPWFFGTKESGIETILKNVYYENNCAKDIIPLNEEINEINSFRIFVLQEMCTTIAKAGINKTNSPCLKKFKEHYPEIVTTVRESLPWLLKKGEIVEIFVDDEPTKLQITQMLSKTEPKIEKFFMECMDKALITDNFYISAQPTYPALGQALEHNDVIAIA